MRLSTATRLASSLVLVLAASNTHAATTAAEVRAVVRKVNDYWLAHNSAGNEGWKRSTYWLGDVAAYTATSNQTYIQRAEAWAAGHEYGADLPRGGAAAAPALVYLWLSQLRGDPSRRAAVVANFRAQANADTIRFKISDDLFGPFHALARIGALEGDTALLSTDLTVFRMARGSIYDTNARLWWRDRNFRGTNVHWSRGNGWAFAGLSQVMASIGPRGPGYSEYLAVFRDMAAALRSRQRSDGFWNTSLSDPSVFPGPETSGTALFAAGYAWGLRAGVLDAATYRPVLRKAWDGLASIAVQPSGAVGYVQPENKQPGPSRVTDGADFGVGVLLFAGWRVADLYAQSSLVSDLR